jgi:hypothetical protein
VAEFRRVGSRRHRDVGDGLAVGKSDPVQNVAAAARSEFDHRRVLQFGKFRSGINPVEEWLPKIFGRGNLAGPDRMQQVTEGGLVGSHEIAGHTVHGVVGSLGQNAS